YARPTAAAAPKLSAIPASGRDRPPAVAGRSAPAQVRPRSTRTLDRVAEPGNRLLWSDRLVLHVFGEDVDHRRRHAVLLRHIVRQAEHGLVGGNGLLERRRRAALAIRPASTGEVDIGAHRN